MNVNKVNPYPVLSCEERIRYIEKQRIAIRSLIEEFGREREVHYTTFKPPFGFVYEGALKDLLVLDLVIYKIIYERERRELYLFYARNRPLLVTIWRKDQVAMMTMTKMTTIMMTQTKL